MIAHYTSIETVLSYIIPSQTLKFTQLEYTNDPYEAHYDWYAGRAIWGTSSGEVDEIGRQNNEIRARISTRLRLACFTRTANGNEECGNNPFLWTYYASNKGGINSGCAVLLDEEILLRELNNCTDLEYVKSTTINYVDELERISRGPINELELFSKKLKFWEREQEYRILIKMRNDTNGPVFRKINGSIVGIVLNGFEVNKLSPKWVESMRLLHDNNFHVYRRYYISHSHSYDIARI